MSTGTFAFKGKTNNQMIKLMMEMKGIFPMKMLKKGAFVSQHFQLDDSGSRILFLDHHPEGQETLKKYVPDSKPTKDLKHTLMKCQQIPIDEENLKIITEFADFLGKCFLLNPEKRINPAEAFQHPFLKTIKPIRLK